MSLESDVVAVLAPLFPVAGEPGKQRVYADMHPQEWEAMPLPFVVFTQVGGTPSNTLCGNTDKQNALLQFNVWAASSQQARQLIRDIEKLVTAPPLRAVSQGGAITRPGPTTKSFGAQQDFSFWHVP